MAVSTYRIILMVALAVLVVSLVTGAVILLARGNASAPIQIIAPTPDTASGSSPSTSKVRPTSSRTDTQLLVYISGAVRNPGVYTLRAGDRLMDGLTAAGGATEDADLSRVNLARRVQDEEHYHIPKAGETPPPASTSIIGVTPSDAPSDARTSKGLINLNTASVDLLVTLPGIGPVRAKAIVDYRERNGLFQSVEEINKVPGIGPASYANIRHLVTVEGAP